MARGFSYSLWWRRDFGLGQQPSISLWCEDIITIGGGEGNLEFLVVLTGVQLDHLPLLPNTPFNPPTTVLPWNVNILFLRAEESAVLLGSVLICVLSEPSFTLVEFGEQKQGPCRAARTCCSDGGTENREPAIRLTWQIYQNGKASFKNHDF